MDALETRQLRYFLAVAEELHFGRAADRLGVAQPSLSRAVRGLERVLGTELFERSTRHVSLTSAGEALVIDARVALDAVSAAGRRAVRAGRAGSTLVVASKPDGDAGVLPELLGALQREAPGVEAELVFAATGDRAASMLRDGRADVALVPAPFDERGLHCDELLAEARVVALPATERSRWPTRWPRSRSAGRTPTTRSLPSTKDEIPTRSRPPPPRLSRRGRVPRTWPRPCGSWSWAAP